METLTTQEKAALARAKFAKARPEGRTANRPAGKLVAFPKGRKTTEEWLVAGGPAILRGVDKDENTVVELEWLPEVLNDASNIPGNVTSRKQFRPANRLEAGIVRIDVIPLTELADEADEDESEEL